MSKSLFTTTPAPHCCYLITHKTHLKNSLLFAAPKLHFPNHINLPGNSISFPGTLCHYKHLPVKAYDSSNQSFEIPHHVSSNSANDFNLDGFLSLIEFLCLISSAIMSVGMAVSNGLSRPLIGWFGANASGCRGLMVWQSVFLLGGVVVGAIIRKRNWGRICNADFSRKGSGLNSRINLVERVEKLEEDLRSSATIIRVLSRQLEKLGIRFRVTRKALKEPIAETAELAQKNSEATRALAAQEDNLEKELGEIQKVLLAMQEQQQKQLELILAIGKAGKLWDSKPVHSKDRNASRTTIAAMDGAAESEAKQIEALAQQKEASNDRA